MRLFNIPVLSVPECQNMPWCETVVTWAVIMAVLSAITVLLLISILVVNSVNHEMHRKHMEPAESIAVEGEDAYARGLSTSSNSGPKQSWFGGAGA
jgi:uncharacterized membrane protein